MADPVYSQFYTNQLAARTMPVWTKMYTYIYAANDAVEQLSASAGVTEGARQQLMGEAKFIRAFCYFYLVNLFGDVPLVLSTDYKETSTMPRVDAKLVYAQIVDDLRAAVSQLSADYLSSSLKDVADDRLRPNKAAASALLARVCLYTGDPAGAAQQATACIENAAYTLESPDRTFLQDSRETIWQLQSYPGILANMSEAKYFVLKGRPTADRPVAISDSLYKAFENGDLRKQHWTGLAPDETTSDQYPFVYKYKVDGYGLPATENLIVLRLAEQYLIRAEARAMLDDLAGAEDDLNEVRRRADLAAVQLVSQQDAVEKISSERRVELFTEWGDRWLNLKRLHLIDSVMQQAAVNKNAVWRPEGALYPIPLRDIETNPALRGHQNAGY